MNNKYKIDDFSCIYKMKTRFVDMDAFQHINNAVYASYIENARVQMFSKWGVEPSNKGSSIIMASLKIDYIEQLKHPASITIGQRISRIGKTSFDIESVIFNEHDEPVCKSLVVCVCFNYDSMKPIDVYSSIKEDYEK